MNTIKRLADNITRFLAEIAAYYNIPANEITAALNEVNFFTLYQTLCREASPVYAFRACRHLPFYILRIPFGKKYLISLYPSCVRKLVEINIKTLHKYSRIAAGFILCSRIPWCSPGIGAEPQQA